MIDEPTVGLHARDSERLLAVLRRLRNAGNTVIVVEHDPTIIAGADHTVELGPGAGEYGGQVVYQGVARPSKSDGLPPLSKGGAEAPHAKVIIRGAAENEDRAAFLELDIDGFYQLYFEASVMQIVSLEDVVGDSEHEDLDPR